ncbi:MAG: NAD-dependent epimerase/dehydratase family protein [Bacteroidales bacterium]|nr:NAD-dependent epimerase/dehydratase family protein [Bacteroidales bacterium]
MSNEKQKQIIVTGGTGLLGSHLLLELSQKENQIVALKRSTSKLTTIEKLFRWHFNGSSKEFEKINWVNGDIADIDSLLEIFTENSQVYHVAGKVSFQEKDKEQLVDINIKGTCNVVNAALEKKIQKLCHVSSIAAIGRSSNNTLTHEDIPLDNASKVSAYGFSKYEGEREVWRGIAEGLHAVIVNPTIILGQGNWHDSSARLFHQVYKGLKFYTNGTNGYVDADDLAKIMIQLMNSEAESQRFIINAENISYQQLFTWIAEALNIKPPKHLAGRLLSEIAWRVLKALSIFTGKSPLITKETAHTANSNYQYSNAKIIKETGYHFKSIEETIKETALYFLQDLKSGI